ncbi:MAG TPA: hypothetical protein PKA66_05255 [Gemmatimonadales bacterium]|nr:hypothetical protein [Gemmatimonadales bacterium]
MRRVRFPWLPDPRLALRVLLRGALLWGLARAALVAVQLAASKGPPGNLLPMLTPSAALGLIGVVVALGSLESRRLNEHRFLANLGISPFVALLLVMLPAVCGEILVTMLRLP